jgi:hypothetical protein
MLLSPELCLPAGDSTPKYRENSCRSGLTKPLSLRLQKDGLWPHLKLPVGQLTSSLNLDLLHVVTC